ncbi:MAG: hypothetical protein IKK35_03540, partial [Rikenellaceae bacterium]|nr:hypothetical protein [Rikenellaceae bacterium]
RQRPQLPPMFPDYADITIPCNIAPLNFEIDSVESIEVLVKGEQDWQSQAEERQCASRSASGVRCWRLSAATN